MSFNFTQILSALNQGVALAESLAPLAKAAGGPDVTKVVNVIAAVNDVAQNVHERISEGTIVATATDQARVQSVIDRLAETNDDLAKWIDENG